MSKILLSLMFIMSCSTVHFKSSNETGVIFDIQPNQEQEVILEVERKFYLWGFYPELHELYLDKIFMEKGFENVSDLRIEEIDTRKKAIWMVATLGMYYPQTYKLVGRVSD